MDKDSSHNNHSLSSSSSTSSNHVKRLLNFDHYTSPSKSLCYDRFIPCRSTSNFSLFNISPSQKHNSTPYNSLLRTALFGPNAPVTPDKRTSPNIFRYKTETHHNMHALSPFLFHHDACPGTNYNYTPSVKPQRKVSKSPFKVLDAPALQDDFYLNLVDWSSNNVLAVGLGSCVYLWNASSSKVTRLCDLGIDDYICSVEWAHRGTCIAVGTSKGKVKVRVYSISCKYDYCLLPDIT
ncbi:putative transcription factor WD40-like family [Lupinus albus]|uniref:Putative transcription factor WD40-like family n=1 Tax=Lupinus albus TaxID=3870 RepID=A0A6A4PZA5_LUPAL|nr:putative transcription factor WD40-like family [Lupinus albus]